MLIESKMVKTDTYCTDTGSINPTFRRKWIFKSTFNELLSPEYTGRYHGECRPHGTHTTVEDESSTQRIGFPDNIGIRIKIIILGASL